MLIIEKFALQDDAVTHILAYSHGDLGIERINDIVEEDRSQPREKHRWFIAAGERGYYCVVEEGALEKAMEGIVSLLNA